MAWSEPQSKFLQDLRDAVSKNEELQSIVKKCADTVTGVHDYVRDGLLYWKNRLVVPNQESLIQQILLEFHTSPIGGHAGITRSVARISAQFYWPRLRTSEGVY